MSIALVYSSVTGNTKKVAEKLNERFGEISYFTKVEDVDFEKINEFENVIVCYWNIKGTLDPKSKDFISSITNKNIVAIGTLGAYPDSEHALRMKKRVREHIELTKNKFCGEFCCQGKIDPKRTERRRAIPKGEPHYLDDEGYKRHLESRKHPNEKDFNDAIYVVESFIKMLKN